MAAFLIKHPGVDCLLLSNNCYHVTRTSEFSFKKVTKETASHSQFTGNESWPGLVKFWQLFRAKQGQKSNIQSKICRNIARLFLLANKPVHFVSSSDSFMTLSVKLLKRPSWMSTTSAVSGIATFAKQSSVQKKIRLKHSFELRWYVYTKRTI